MDHPSTPICNVDEGLASLQIDCDLGASTSLTWASTPPTTPTSDDTGNDGDSGATTNNEPSSEWIELYKRLKRTPPKATRTSQFQATLTTANALLKLSDEPKFKKKSFDKLTPDQQAILMLMIMKGVDTIFEGTCSRQQSAKILIKALDPDSKEYKRMKSFVRGGGDFPCPTQSSLQRKVVKRVQKFPPKATTIFTDRPNMSPCLHLQQEDSYICAYHACSALMYYCSHNNKGENDYEKIPTIKMNISRYIRDEVPGLEIANFTLTTVKGAYYLDRVLLGLMKSFGTTECNDVEKIPTWDQNEDQNFSQLKTYLDNGRPFVFGIECFPSLADTTKSQYKGKVSGHYGVNERPKDPKDRIYHALLCIGITPRQGPLPPMLLVQDSCPFRSVYEIGLDLLMDFGLEGLGLCTVPKKWTFNENMDYMVSPETKALFCGSPMSLDDKAVPRIIKPEKTTQQRKDMRRYLDEVYVKPGEPIVVIT